MKSKNPRPILPKGVVYRHGLAVVITLALMGEFILYAATMSNHLNGSNWRYLWGFCAVALPIATVWRLIWLEKHGWWKRRVAEIPDLPFECRGLDWKATFEMDHVVGQGGQLSGASRSIRYADIKRVELGPKAGLNIVESGKVPLTLGAMADNFVIIAILARHAPQAEFRGATAPMRDGWEPRF